MAQELFYSSVICLFLHPECLQREQLKFVMKLGIRVKK